MDNSHQHGFPTNPVFCHYDVMPGQHTAVFMKARGAATWLSSSQPLFVGHF